MQTARRPTGAARLVAALALALLAPRAALPEPEAEPALAVGVVAAVADERLQPIAQGYDRWLATELSAAGIAVVPLAGSLEAALPEARAQGLSRLLAPRLDTSEWRATVQLPLVAPGSGSILGGARAEVPVADLAAALAGSLDALRTQLGVAPAAPTPPPLIDDLASASRALAAWQAGDWVRAWNEVQGRLSPTAMSLREEIVEAARGHGGPLLQRARVLAAAGDVLSAARLVGRDAAAALRSETGDPALLVAGGDVALARGDAAAARASFERALAHDAEDADATLGLARALALEGDAAGARQAYERAAQIAPADPQPLALLAELEADAPASAARHWLEAGRRSAQQLEVQRARTQIERAVALDPTLAGDASLASGALEERIGRPAEALAAYRRAAGAGVRTPELLVATGRTQRALGQAQPAQASLEAALEQAPQNPAALSELGALYLETGRPALALPMLEAARAADAHDRAIRLRHAQALHASGRSDEAAALLAAEDAIRAERRLAVEIETARGDLAAARRALERAVAADPLEPSLREQSAAVLESLGDTAAAAAERQMTALLAGPEAKDDADSARSAIGALTLDELVTSFAAQVPMAADRRMALLGLREPNDWRMLAWRLLRPRGPDARGVADALETAIAGRFGRAEPLGSEGSDVLAAHIDRLFAFERDDSLDAQTIAAVNQVLGSDGVFVGRVVDRIPIDSDHVCDEGDFALELRLLAGRDPELVSALSNVDCVRGGLAIYRAWNWPGLALYALLALFVGWPLLRGWGAIEVAIKLPDRTKGFFSIHITRRPDAVKKTVDKKSDRKQMKTGRLDFLKRFERHMAGRETIFRWIPARKLPYTVTVAGPLLDARGEEIIGHFMEEQRVQVGRGMTSKLVFDFRPRECAVEVRISEDRRPASRGRVAVEGDPSSLRYARDGMAYLYLGVGRYTILVGSADAAAALPLEIHSVESAIPLQIDLAEDAGAVVFRGCPEAVDPYLQSDLASAAAALERGGLAEAAHRMRAELFRRQGRHEEAAREFEAGGQLENAAEMRASGSDYGGSAELFEQAGDFSRAAEAYHAAGAFADAARCYELSYDYPRAIECWREIGDRERELELQEKLGEYLEAARLARELGDADRALSLLGHIDSRHAAFAEACRAVAEIAGERGDFDLAASKLEEALGDGGMETASVELLEEYAGALERAERHPQALSAWEVVRRRDASRSDVGTRIQRLRQEIASASAAVPASSSQIATRPAAAQESRYELLEELGRGGMGIVYKARDKRLGRIVALKRLPENLKHHPQAVALFEREARAAAALNHRNIVTLFDAGEENGTYFISMELLEGRPLHAILAKSVRLRAGDVVRLGVQICAGLHVAHERRIVHRDIKAANLFFTNERVVKIMDFGIAKSLEEVRRQATVIGGTPYYMAPEQAAGEGVDHRADLYAFGVTLFQLVTGTLPFADGDVSYRHRHEAPPDPREIVADLPERMARLILALMAKRPEERPQSAAEVAEVLKALHAELAARRGA